VKAQSIRSNLGAWYGLLLAAASLLGACATPYGQASSSFTGYGYQDYRIDSNTVSVSFSGNGMTSKQAVEMNLLYRCAQITQDSGYDYFVIADQSTEATLNSSPGYYTGVQPAFIAAPGAWPGQYYSPGTYFPGVIWTEYGSQATIKMFKGQKPEGNPLAYNARDVLEHLGPDVVGGASPSDE
jgi:hypothetical protein